MNRLKFWFLLSSAAFALCSRPAHGAEGGNDTLTKDLWSASGNANVISGDTTLTYSFGETSSQAATDGTHQVVPGYTGGRFGNGAPLHVIGVTLDSAPFMSNGVPYGIPLPASAHVQLSDQNEADSLISGISVVARQDHLGQVSNQPAAVQLAVDPGDPTGHTLLVTPLGGWQGNTLYSVLVSTALQSVDGFPTDEASDFRFSTLLDPNQENVVSVSLGGAASPAHGLFAAASANSTLSIRIPAGALSQYYTVLTNDNPQSQPLSVDPQAVVDANAKALAARGPYSIPLALEEISLVSASGQKISALSKPAQASLGFSSVNGLAAGSPIVRAGTLRLYALDETHHLWVEMPDSSPNGQTVSGAFNRSTVFALIGSPAGSASDVYVFPTPWRPHGPGQGDGAGQTGTEAGGLTFTNLPSECTVRIYTLSGQLVRTLSHSDTAGTLGQEKWDGSTSGGSHAASGVYLWRVESNTDSKNGKLMIIR